MTPKQRLLAAITGESVDRIPWSPFLAYWWEAQPQSMQAEGQISFMKKIGADPLLRGFHELFTIEYGNCTTSEKIHGKNKIERYETPVGSLTAEYTFVELANTWFLTSHPVSSEEDFKILTYISEDIRLIPSMEQFVSDYKSIGEDGLFLPTVGTYSKTSFQALLEHWVGTQELVYALADYPNTVEQCLYSMQEKSLQSVEIAVTSPAEGFIFWEDSSTTNMSPSMFETYSAPEINQWGKIIHNNGKKLIHHACGHVNDLLPLMAKTDIDAIESISPPPTGNVEIWDARSKLPDNIALIGGIEPTFLLRLSLDELEEYVHNLLDRMGKTSYILANSDSCPPGVEIEKFKKITELVGNYY